MEIFRTLVPVVGFEKKIKYSSGILLSGSCFSENIGLRMEEVKLNADNNPFGIVFNPISVMNGLQRLMDDVSYQEKDLFEQDNVWCSFDHHSRFNDTSKIETLRNINNRLQISSKNLKTAEFLFITFGTAFVYENKESGNVVSNCHKVPLTSFQVRRISVEEIVSSYKKLFERLKLFNPGLTIVFTVSPVRHWKDGAHENQLSKATLLLAIDALCKLFTNCKYFPSYEILMDELRDYRFYDEDMLHPSKTAINYIWHHFKESFFDAGTITVMKEVEKVLQAYHHNPFNTTTDNFKSFASQQLEKIRFLKDQFAIDLSKEEAYFKGFLM